MTPMLRYLRRTLALGTVRQYFRSEPRLRTISITALRQDFPVPWNVHSKSQELEVLVPKFLHEVRTIGWSCDASVDRRPAGPT